MSGTRYPTYQEIRARRIAERRAAALDALRRADAAVRAAGGRLLVFGSLAEGRFDEHSDLDVALFGLPAGRDSDVAAEVDTILTLAGFEADVIPERFLSPSLHQRVVSNGCDPGTFDYSRTAGNVPIAVGAEQALRADIEAFATAIGIQRP